jgi:hypothetical protein
MDRISVIELENQPPISGHRYCPLAFGAIRRVHRGEKSPQPGGVLGVYALRRSCHKEPLKPFMAKTLYHRVVSVRLHVTFVKSALRNSAASKPLIADRARLK